MTLALVFNHDSLPFDNIEQAKAGIHQFIQIVTSCNRRYGIGLLLLDNAVGRSLFDVEFASAFNGAQWFDWAKQQSELRDEIRRFRSLETRQPMLLPHHEQQVGHSLEVGLKGQPVGLSSLQATYFYDLFLISFGYSFPWDQLFVDVWVIDLSEDCTEPTDTQLRNLNDPVSFEYHAAALRAARDERLSGGKNLWENRATFLPNLILLNELGGQLRRWTHSPAILTKAKDALLVMNEFAALWQSGHYDVYQHAYLAECGLAAEVSGESVTVNETPKKRAEREFYLPNGNKKNFEYHVKLQNGFRLHFYPSSIEKTIYIGYLGPHLSV